MIIDWVKRGWIAGRNAQAILRSASVWLDPSDLTGMWQSTAGNGAHPGANDPVGAVLNKGSAGGLFTAASGSARPTLRNSGALWWMEADGVDDWMASNPLVPLGATWWHVGSWRASADASNRAFANLSGSDVSPLLPRQAGVQWSAVVSSGDIANYGARSGARDIVSLRVTNGSAASRINGTPGATLTLTDQLTGTQGLALFSGRNSIASRLFAGDFGGGVWGVGDISDAALRAVELRFAALSGVTL